MYAPLIIFGTPALSLILLALDAVWPLSGHIALGVLAVGLAVAGVLAVRAEARKP